MLCLHNQNTPVEFLPLSTKSPANLINSTFIKIISSYKNWLFFEIPMTLFLTLFNNFRISNSKITKSEENLKLLKAYDYEEINRYNTITGTSATIYRCTFENCGKEMETTWNMLDHARMHKGIKPYSCKFCGKRFTQKGNMRKHSRLHLTPSVESRRKYQCKYCHSKFTETYNLIVSTPHPFYLILNQNIYSKYFISHVFPKIDNFYCYFSCSRLNNRHPC